MTNQNKYTMNIQDKMQEIHHKFGVTEKANYEIQLFVDDLIKKDRANQLILNTVSQQSELLIKFSRYLRARDLILVKAENLAVRVKLFLESN